MLALSATDVSVSIDGQRFVVEGRTSVFGRVTDSRTHLVEPPWCRPPREEEKSPSPRRDVTGA